MLVALLFGTVSISAGEIVAIVLHKFGLAQAQAGWAPGDENIIWNIRLPRVVAAALVGGALGVAGALFQAVLRNPLADPYVIGTSAGAQLGVTLAYVLSIQVAIGGFGSVQLMAFVGALGTVLFVYALARSSGGTPIVTLLLAGFVVSSFLISATFLLATVSNRVNQIIFWTMGGVANRSWSELGVIAPAILLCAAIALLLAPRLDALQLGEDQAAHLGIRVERVKLACIVLGSFATALAVSLAGVVAFVGLIIPHTARMVFGPGHRVLVPTSLLGGALFVVIVDLLARTVVSPTELPLGVMTAVVGAPFFLHLLRRSRRDYAM
jgi:iron complex transport system permease protein